MTRRFAQVLRATGAVVCVVQYPESFASPQDTDEIVSVEVGEDFPEFASSSHCYRFDTEDFAEMPPRPSAWHEFDHVAWEWVDGRGLEDIKEAKWKELRERRDAEEFGSFEWDGSAFDCDDVSQRRIQGAVQMAVIASSTGSPFSIDWTLADNTVRTLSATQMIQVGLALGAHVSALHEKGRQKRQAIESAPNKVALAAITWD